MLKTLLSYGLGAVGLIVLLMAMAQAIAANLNYASARYTIINLLRSAPNNAEMMARSAPMTFFEPLGAVMKTLAMCRSNDPVLISKTSGPTYDGNCSGIAGKWTAIMVKAKLALMAVGGGLALGLSGDSFPILLALVSAAAGTVFLVIYLKKTDTEKAMLRARAEILPEIERAFIESRYVFPPLPQ